MKNVVLTVTLFALASWAIPAGAQDYSHVEVGVFANYFNLSRTSPHTNYVGAGARASFNVHPNVQIEAEMAYDFERNFTSVFSNGVETRFVRSQVRPLHALFGPKFQTGSGSFRAFGTFKVGLINFSTSNRDVETGFEGALGAVTSGDTRAAIYPGVGVEGFWGPFGLRLDGGDEIYFDRGARNNLRVTFGPVFRF